MDWKVQGRIGKIYSMTALQSVREGSSSTSWWLRHFQRKIKFLISVFPGFARVVEVHKCWLGCHTLCELYRKLQRYCKTISISHGACVMVTDSFQFLSSHYLVQYLRALLHCFCHWYWWLLKKLKLQCSRLKREPFCRILTLVPYTMYHSSMHGW